MNSIEIAKKLIEENDEDIADLRNAETIIQKRIEEYEQDIVACEKRLNILRHALSMAEEDLQRKRDLKKEYLVDNLALKMFIANGGGLDMLD